MYRPNWIELDGVVNMRDLGGMVTAGGDTVRPHRLLRSDNLQDLTPEAVEVLVSRVGLRDVVDLRTHVEVAKEGDGPLRAVPVVRHHHHTLYREDSLESGIPAAERALPWESDERRYTSTAGSPDPANGSPEPANAPERRPSHDEFWSEHYLSYLASRPDSVVAALHAIAASDGAVVVHCAAGKDRTGTVVGLALKVVGVPDELVIADYAASAERVGAIMDRLRVKPAYAANLRDKTVAQQSPTTDTMRLLLATLDERFGGALGWLATRGWTRSDTDRLRRKLLDD
ncbi:tyrosine-protein phosphatase [Terrabacter sp. NPDC080008]|uniref:tyrosine-protein phosphatase n=1 Tax=Terrabacter sp. NPDC080008 TaxID=3155176 RepID=UPI00344BB907